MDRCRRIALVMVTLCDAPLANALGIGPGEEGCHYQEGRREAQGSQGRQGGCISGIHAFSTSAARAVQLCWYGGARPRSSRASWIPSRRAASGRSHVLLAYRTGGSLVYDSPLCSGYLIVTTASWLSFFLGQFSLGRCHECCFIFLVTSRAWVRDCTIPKEDLSMTFCSYT